jgi:TonB family protein
MADHSTVAPVSRSSAFRDRDLIASVLRYGIPLSLFVHLCFLVLLAKSTRVPPVGPQVMEVSLASLPELKGAAPQRAAVQPKQIVSPPQSKPVLEPPPDARFLSDQNMATAKEQIRRGDQDAGVPGPKGPKGAEPREKPKKSVPAPAPAKGVARKSASEQPTRKLAQLTLDPQTVREKFGVKEGEERGKELQNQKTSVPFSRPSGSGAMFMGRHGSNDYLPNLPDGDITLLNTKADQHAVFVRRVASQVFSQIRSAGWDTLLARDIQMMRGFSTVEAVMSLSGELLGVKLVERSGSERFDSALVTASRTGTRDPNPPAAAAAEDGKIHFVFKAKSWVQLGVNSRTGAPVERRWLLLQTGLE